LKRRLKLFPEALAGYAGETAALAKQDEPIIATPRRPSKQHRLPSTMRRNSTKPQKKSAPKPIPER
jgi:hypothetical protein